MGRMENCTKIGDIGPPERHSRGDLEVVKIKGRDFSRVRNVSPLHLYFGRDQITDVQFYAGQKLHQHFINGWVGQKDCEYREPVDGGGRTLEPSDRQLHAIKQYKRGIEAAGANKKIVTDVCIDEEFISQIVKHWYTRKKMKERLKLALNDIATVYGL